MPTTRSTDRCNLRTAVEQPGSYLNSNPAAYLSAAPLRRAAGSLRMRRPGALANRVNNGLRKGGQEEKGEDGASSSIGQVKPSRHTATPPLRRLG